LLVTKVQMGKSGVSTWVGSFTTRMYFATPIAIHSQRCKTN
jgi:hypothetical protein